MIAPLSTLAFLATMWLLVVLGASVLEESGAKIAAALKGKPERREPAAPPMRMRVRYSTRWVTHDQPSWRAAA